MIEKLVRKNIQEALPYRSARDEFSGRAAVFLDANENPFGTLNRYPDPAQKKLKELISGTLPVAPSNIFIGNGSDEVIDLAVRIFCEPGKDKVMICPPTYGMYKVTAQLNNAGIVEVPLTGSFQPDTEAILSRAVSEHTKILFLCSPNNPTGNTLNNPEEIIRRFPGIVFLDEAYIEFSTQPSLLGRLSEFPNLIISRTLSKAAGLAGARIGMAFASAEIISYYTKVKPPYNVSTLNQTAAIEALNRPGHIRDTVRVILDNRDELIGLLEQLPVIEKIYPTEANFVLVRVGDADAVYKYLTAQGIITRNRKTEIPETIRITAGTREENMKLIKALKNL